MTKRIYIIGAGASCAQGLPAMNSLTWELCKFLSESDSLVLEKVIFEIFGVRREIGDPSPNFEELLNHLDLRSLSYIANCGIDLSAIGRTQAIEIALRGLRKYIRKKCTDVKDQVGPYDQFVTNLEPNATIVSFNWDVLLELSLMRAGRPFCYLPENAPEGHTLILKPHGSINWFALLDRELLTIDTTSNVDAIGGNLAYYLLHLKNPLGPTEMGASSPFAKSAISKVPAIVPPSSAKLLDVGGETRDGFVDHGHREALCKVWKHFYENVSVADELIVIGYSLPGTDAASIEVLKAFCDCARRQKVFIIDKSQDVFTRYCNIVHPEATLVGEDFGTFDWLALKNERSNNANARAKINPNRWDKT